MENNGSVHYSPVRSIVANGEGNRSLLVYPNPASRRIVIPGNFPPASVLSIYDGTGRLIYQNMAGGSTISQDISFLKKGVYGIKLRRLLPVGQGENIQYSTFNNQQGGKAV